MYSCLRGLNRRPLFLCGVDWFQLNSSLLVNSGAHRWLSSRLSPTALDSFEYTSRQRRALSKSLGNNVALVFGV